MSAASAVRGPRGLPVLGVLPQFARDPLRFFERAQRTYGDVVVMPFASTTTVLVSHPTWIEQVLVRDHGGYVKDRFTRGMGSLLGRGLLTAEGGDWAIERRRMAPSFTRSTIGRYADAMVELASEQARELRDGQVIDVHRAMMTLTLRVIAETMFDADVSDRTEQIGAAVDLALHHFMRELTWMGRFLPRWVPTRGRARYRASLSRLDELLYEVIADRRRRGSAGEDLLGRLLDARTDDGSAVPDALIRDETITIFLAGHETTALALTHTFRLLSEHPRVAEALHREIDEVLGRRAPGADDVSSLRLTEAVLKESMRLCPPVWAIAREATRATEIERVRVEAGAQVVMSQWVVHRDGRWYDAPASFRPERWLDGSTHALPRFAYFPFGGGPRVCIGNHFASMEAVLLLATLAARWRFEPVEPVALEPVVTLRPRHGQRMRVRSRARA